MAFDSTNAPSPRQQVPGLVTLHARRAAASPALTSPSPVLSPLPPAPQPAPVPQEAPPPQPSQSQPTRNNDSAYARLRAQLSEVRLDLVLERLDAEPMQDGDSHKWKIAGFGNILVKGQAWKNANTERRGYGGVYLVSQALEIPDREAVAWMRERFGDEVDPSVIAASQQAVKQSFSPPVPVPARLPDVRRYLVQDRFLPQRLVDEEIAAGHIYATLAASSRSAANALPPTECVFLAPESAEIRGTDRDGFKGCCAGSSALSGYRIVQAQAPDEQVMALTEAAVDALSYRALFPGRYALSTNGSGKFHLQLQATLEALEAGYAVRLAFDADWAGDLAAQRVFNALFLRYALSHRLKVPPQAVDAWILENQPALSAIPCDSPHEMFLRDGWKPQAPVLVHKVQRSADGHAKACMVPDPHRQHAPPSVRFNVLKQVHPDLPMGWQELPVSAMAMDYLTHIVDVRRDRPMIGKDWNDELKDLGKAFALEYERLAADDFEAGTPALPPRLQALRTPPPRLASPQPASAPLPPKPRAGN